LAAARKILAILTLAYNRFALHDGWAIASHIALSALFSFFPFLILLTSLAATFEFGTLADNATDIILDVLPAEIAGPLAAEVRTVLTEWRGDLLTIGAALALYFSSNGIEALRVGLNRAYGVRENRSWYVTRLESIVFVAIMAAVMMVYSLVFVLGPLLWRAAMGFFPFLSPFSQAIGALRFGATTLLIAVALVVTHKYLAAGYRSFASVLPGVAVTLVLWVVGGLAFGFYLAQFPGSYASTYGGLATAMMSLIFLYTIAIIFIVGGEINGAAIALAKSAKKSRAARG